MCASLLAGDKSRNLTHTDLCLSLKNAEGRQKRKSSCPYTGAHPGGTAMGSLLGAPEDSFLQEHWDPLIKTPLGPTYTFTMQLPHDHSQ